LEGLCCIFSKNLRKFSGNKNFRKFSGNFRKDWNKFPEISGNFSEEISGNFRTYNPNPLTSEPHLSAQTDAATAVAAAEMKRRV